MIETEIQGAVSARKHGYDGLYIYFKEPSIQALEHRIRSRGQNTEASIARRLDKSRLQIDEYEQHKDSFDHTIVNDDIEQCWNQVDGLIDKYLISKYKNRL